jgi:putative SOS response-associated peptidase YedK
MNRLTQPLLMAGSLRWGFVPSWSKDGKIAPINAMSETAADKPMFRGAFRKRRCLLPASGFYEWKATGAKKKQPYAIRLADDKPSRACGRNGPRIGRGRR